MYVARHGILRTYVVYRQEWITRCSPCPLFRPRYDEISGTVDLAATRFCSSRRRGCRCRGQETGIGGPASLACTWVEREDSVNAGHAAEVRESEIETISKLDFLSRTQVRTCMCFLILQCTAYNQSASAVNTEAAVEFWNRPGLLGCRGLHKRRLARNGTI